MNDLSWLIYLAGVSGNVGGFLVVTSIGGGVGALGCGVGHMMARDFHEDDEPIVVATAKWAKRLMIAAFVAGAVATLVPGRDTIYAIAASEMGEELLKTPIASKAGKALEAWVDKQIASATDGPAEGQDGQLRDAKQ